jgi:hypothetical protein
MIPKGTYNLYTRKLIEISQGTINYAKKINQERYQPCKKINQGIR